MAAVIDFDLHFDPTFAFKLIVLKDCPLRFLKTIIDFIVVMETAGCPTAE